MLFICSDQERRIIHLTSSAEVKVSWQQIIEIGLWVVENKIPLNWVMWYPGGSMKSTRLHHKLCTIFYHWLPAILIDILLFCIGQQPMYESFSKIIIKSRYLTDILF